MLMVGGCVDELRCIDIEANATENDPVNVTSKEEVVAIDSTKICSLMPYFSSSRDEFDPNGCCLFKPKSISTSTDKEWVYLYFNEMSGRVDDLHLSVRRYGDKWLFIRKIQFLVDNRTYEIRSPKSNVNYEGRVASEQVDQKMSSADVPLIEALASSEKAKMKIIGQEDHEILQITSAQLMDIKRSIELFRAMGGRL